MISRISVAIVVRNWCREKKPATWSLARSRTVSMATAASKIADTSATATRARRAFLGPAASCGECSCCLVMWLPVVRLDRGDHGWLRTLGNTRTAARHLAVLAGDFRALDSRRAYAPL